MEKYSVIESKNTYPNEEVMEVFLMPAKDVLETLRQHPETWSIFTEHISLETFSKLNDPQFLNSEEYQSLVKYIDSIGQTNQEALKSIGDISIYKNFSGNLQKYLEENKIEASVKDIADSIKNTHVISLDIYRYEAIKLKYGLNIGSGAKAFYVSTLDSVIINLRDTEFGREILDQNDLFTLHCEMINAVLSHELVHSVAYQNLWNIKKDEQTSDDTIVERRSGISNKRPDGREKLIQLNEAITQKIALDILTPVFDYSSPGNKPNHAKISKEQFAEKVYKNEREVLDILLKKIDWKMFLESYFKKHELLDLDKEIKKQFGVTLKEISESMKAEIAGDQVTKYSKTRELLNA